MSKFSGVQSHRCSLSVGETIKMLKFLIYRFLKPLRVNLVGLSTCSVITLTIFFKRVLIALFFLHWFKIGFYVIFTDIELCKFGKVWNKH